MRYLHGWFRSARRQIQFRWRVMKFRFYGFCILYHFPPGRWLSFDEVLAFGYPVGETRTALTLMTSMDILEARINVREISKYPPEAEVQLREILALIPADGAEEDMLEYRMVNRPPAPDRRMELRALHTLRA